MAGWQTGVFLQSYSLKTYFIKLPVQSLIWAQQEGPYFCVSALVPQTLPGRAGTEMCRVAEMESSGRRGQSSKERRETVSSFLHSGKEGWRVCRLIHRDNLCEEPPCLILKRLHNSFDGFERRLGKKLTSFLGLLSRVNKVQLRMFSSKRAPLPGTQRSSLWLREFNKHEEMWPVGEQRSDCAPLQREPDSSPENCHKLGPEKHSYLCREALSDQVRLSPTPEVQFASFSKNLTWAGRQEVELLMNGQSEVSWLCKLSFATAFKWPYFNYVFFLGLRFSFCAMG